MGDNQAQEGRAGRQARQDLHPSHQGNQQWPPRSGGDPDMQPAPARRPSWRRSPRTCPPTTSSAPSSAAPANCPGLTYEEFVLEGYGPGGVALLAGNFNRQPQPHGQRNSPRLRQERRQHGRSGRGLVDVSQEGRHRDSQVRGQGR